MKTMGNILLALTLLFCCSCDDTKEYPWNDDWNQTEQETPDQQEPDTPTDPETPEDPEDPGTTVDPENPEVDPENPEVDPEDPKDDPEGSGDQGDSGDQGGSDNQGESGNPVPEGWTDVSSTFGELPSYIRILKSPAELQGKKAIAYVAEADMNQAQWDVWSVKILEGKFTEQTNDYFKTPSDVYESEEFPVIINGGYFYYVGSNRYTASLATRNSEILAYNIGYEYDDAGNTCFPVRAAFRQSENGTYDACWTYAKWDFSHYMYQVPSSDPSKTPSATYPEEGVVFEAKTAIGGGPVLINDGEIINSYVQEMFYGINPDANQPRTAIGITAEAKMILFVCEGRQMTEGVTGLTTADVAEVLVAFGCVEAINLDGGGSSCMLVNGKETIKVCDGSQRSVASTVMLK